jgi:hypothetical protein
MAGKKQTKSSVNQETATPVVVQETTTNDSVSPVVVQESTSVVVPKGRKVKTPVVATPVVATPVVATPVVATPVVATPVVATPVVAAPTQKGGKKAKSVNTTAVEVTTTVATSSEKTGKKVKVEKVDVPVVSVSVTENEAEPITISERHIRSFKVKLPNKEEFEGRFTGLTPYQAANKALSKYFRETEVPSTEITFSICESTRKSKKSVYTYVGRRQKLDVPVTYKIQDGREIVKNFKNSLKKVKKSDTVETTTTIVASA